MPNWTELFDRLAEDVQDSAEHLNETELLYAISKLELALNTLKQKALAPIDPRD